MTCDIYSNNIYIIFQNHPQRYENYNFRFIWHCRERKIRCLKRDLNPHLRVYRSLLYPLSYWANGDWYSEFYSIYVHEIFSRQLVLEDEQCFNNSISEPSSVIRKLISDLSKINLKINLKLIFLSLRMILK